VLCVEAELVITEMRSIGYFFLRAALVLVVTITAVALVQALEEDEGREGIQVQLDFLPGKNHTFN
jgi:hypothetical protein